VALQDWLEQITSQWLRLLITIDGSFYPILFEVFRN